MLPFLMLCKTGSWLKSPPNSAPLFGGTVLPQSMDYVPLNKEHQICYWFASFLSFDNMPVCLLALISSHSFFLFIHNYLCIPTSLHKGPECVSVRVCACTWLTKQLPKLDWNFLVYISITIISFFYTIGLCVYICI